MARGDKEYSCFNTIRRELFTEEALNCSFEEFCKNRIFLSKKPMERFFAMTEQDIDAVEDMFFKAVPNENASRFPDFVSDLGFIEHFQITSSELTKAGADFKKEFSRHDKEFYKEEKKLQEEMNETPSYDGIRSVEKAFSYKKKHSHENLINSLKQSVDKHIKSERAYEGPKTTKIFLIEYDELSLRLQIDYPNVKSERAYGDLLRREETTDYRLSRDKEALKVIYDKRDYIDFVVFTTDFLFEIIKVKDIPEIMKLLVYDYEFHSVMVTTLSSMFGTSVPLPPRES